MSFMLDKWIKGKCQFKYEMTEKEKLMEESMSTPLENNKTLSKDSKGTSR